jgi:hypothetical protein
MSRVKYRSWMIFLKEFHSSGAAFRVDNIAARLVAVRGVQSRRLKQEGEEAHAFSNASSSSSRRLERVGRTNAKGCKFSGGRRQILEPSNRFVALADTMEVLASKVIGHLPKSALRVPRKLLIAYPAAGHAPHYRLSPIHSRPVKCSNTPSIP